MSFLGSWYDWKGENDHNELVYRKPGKNFVSWKKKTGEFICLLKRKPGEIICFLEKIVSISSTGSNRRRCTQCDEGKQNLSGVTIN